PGPPRGWLCPLSRGTARPPQPASRGGSSVLPRLTHLPTGKAIPVVARAAGAGGTGGQGGGAAAAGHAMLQAASAANASANLLVLARINVLPISVGQKGLELC